VSVVMQCGYFSAMRKSRSSVFIISNILKNQQTRNGFQGAVMFAMALFNALFFCSNNKKFERVAVLNLAGPSFLFENVKGIASDP
jgi:hypothetical protein